MLQELNINLIPSIQQNIVKTYPNYKRSKLRQVCVLLREKAYHMIEECNVAHANVTCQETNNYGYGPCGILPIRPRSLFWQV